MKRKILIMFIVTVVTFGLSINLFTDVANASDISDVGFIEITSYPTKTTYVTGEDLDFSDMVITAYHLNGTAQIVEDYLVEGYNSNAVGIQTVSIKYGKANRYMDITVLPGKVTNVTVINQTKSEVTLSWNNITGISRYELYSVDKVTGSLNFAGFTKLNNYTLRFEEGTSPSYKICAVGDVNGREYRGDYSDEYLASSKPGKVTGLTVTSTSSTVVSLGWKEVTGATGYIIYRSQQSKIDYIKLGTTNTPSYTDIGLSANTGYQYKVSAYIMDEANSGEASDVVKVNTLSAKLAIKYKAGDSKVRLILPKVTGATSYDIYMAIGKGEYKLLNTLNGSQALTYIAEGLTNNQTYSFYMIAKSIKNGIINGISTDAIVVTPTYIDKTNKAAKLFPTQSEFKASDAYKDIPFFKKNVIYTKSYKIPGLIFTNIDGFASSSMCPQGMTFAEDYLLLTAYDMKNEENSVIYVMDKEKRILVTTLILPVKAHAGGISFDGVNVWVNMGSKVSSIPFNKIKDQINAGGDYIYVQFNTTSQLEVTASYSTYHDGKLWVGAYNELQMTKMNSYTIDNTDIYPTLTKVDTIIMPTRVQGIAFTENGSLIISRSCQLYKGLRGYMRQLDVYKPDFSTEGSGSILLGELVKSVEMPSMNEEIAIYGPYLYVNFESAAFEKASYKMDRICAFKLSSIISE